MSKWHILATLLIAVALPLVLSTMHTGPPASATSGTSAINFSNQDGKVIQSNALVPPAHQDSWRKEAPKRAEGTGAIMPAILTPKVRLARLQPLLI
jgi:hypothetical protein